MNIVKRKYQPGDEMNINKLYKLITSRDRNIEQYRWEWIDTWNGKGSMWLAFDEDREEGDKLIMQYSLLPIPFSIFGNSYLAGKTENCMCHPDFRGKGQFFLHEKESFEEAKKQFDLFFTTAGDVSQGIVGAVRRKLGYIAFDSWTRYVFCTNSRYLLNLFFYKLKKHKKIPIILAKFLSALVSCIFTCYFKLYFPPKPSADIRIFNQRDVPLNEIDSFWKRNKSFYMITVDRQSTYLDWRINKNPYFDYKYLFYYKENYLTGYAIFCLNKDNIYLIEDLIVENKDTIIFDTIISYLIWYAKQMGVDAVSCGTLSGNTLLKAVFLRNKFIDLMTLKKILEYKENQKPFHIYLSSNIERKQDFLDPQSWYVTALVTEGRIN